MNFIRNPISSFFLRLLYSGPLPCNKCKVPFEFVEKHKLPGYNILSTSGLCQYCWDRSTLKEILIDVTGEKSFSYISNHIRSKDWDTIRLNVENDFYLNHLSQEGFLSVPLLTDVKDVEYELINFDIDQGLDEVNDWIVKNGDIVNWTFMCTNFRHFLKKETIKRFKNEIKVGRAFLIKRGITLGF